MTEPDEAPEAAARLRRYIDSPVLTGIDVTFQGFDAYDVEPGTVPDLFASRPIVVFGKWRGSAGGSIEISGTTGRGAYQTSIAVSPANVDESHAALRHLWARTRIADLSDFGPATPSEERVAEITSLGLTYSLLTRYTSFIAVQEIVRTTDERRRCRSAAAAAGGRVRSRGRRHQRRRAGDCCGWSRSRRALLGVCHAAARAAPAVRRSRVDEDQAGGRWPSPC